MLVEVVCGTCGNQVVASCETDDPQVIGMLMVSAHATAPHSSPHALTMRVGGLPQERLAPAMAPETRPLNGHHELHIRCLQPGCNNAGGREWRNSVPAELSSGMVISFHSAHEGHPLEVFYDGKKMHPPEA